MIDGSIKLWHAFADHKVALLLRDCLWLQGSAGINVAGAMRVAEQLGPGHTVATMLCDRAERYAGKLYNPAFLESKGLPPPPWLDSPPVSLPEGVLESCLAEAE